MKLASRSGVGSIGPAGPAGAKGDKGDKGDAGQGGFTFPVGWLLISTVNTNPGTFLGYGTWAAFGAGRVLVGLDSGDADFNSAEKTGGEKTVTLTTAQMPAHTHAENSPTSAGGGSQKMGQDTNSNGSTASGLNTASAGGGNAHPNVQPYIVVYFWKRTA